MKIMISRFLWLETISSLETHLLEACRLLLKATSHRSLSHLFRWEATRRIGCPGRGWVECHWGRSHISIISTGQVFVFKLGAFAVGEFPKCRFDHIISMKVSWLCRCGWVRNWRLGDNTRKSKGSKSYDTEMLPYIPLTSGMFLVGGFFFI